MGPMGPTIAVQAVPAQVLISPTQVRHPTMSANELQSAMFYWLDLLTDDCRKACMEMASVIAKDIRAKLLFWQSQGRPIQAIPFQELPNNMDQFRQGLSALSSADLEQYLTEYGVVASAGQSSSLWQQLVEMEQVGSISMFETLDERTHVLRPPIS